jgi:hypothetical protein
MADLDIEALVNEVVRLRQAIKSWKKEEALWVEREKAYQSKIKELTAWIENALAKDPNADL